MLSSITLVRNYHKIEFTHNRYETLLEIAEKLNREIIRIDLDSEFLFIKSLWNENDSFVREL